MKHGYARGFPLLDLRMDRVGGGVAIESLPFALGDATAGTENELQAIVIGKRNTVDLPVTIERSKYYVNVARRVVLLILTFVVPTQSASPNVLNGL